MKKMKWTMIPVLALALMLSLIISAPEAKADANLLENGSVQYAYVESAEGLRQWIDNYGAYSVQEEISEDTEYSNVYKIILDEPGQLIICPLARYRSDSTDGLSFSLFADFALQGEIAETDTLTSDREPMLSQNVDAGTYYFRYSQGKYSKFNAVLTAYIGFIPVSGNMRQDTVTEEAMEKVKLTYQDVPFVYTENASYFARQIDDELAASSNHLLHGTNESEYMQFSVDEAGTMLIAPLCFDSNTYFELYSDAVFSSKIGMISTIENTREGFLYVHVEPGTYYYRSYERYDNNSNKEIRVYLGLIPDSGIMKPNSFIESEGKASIAVEPKEIRSFQEFEDYVRGSKPTFSSVITTDSASTLYSFAVEESGILYLTSMAADKSNGAIRLYTNRETSSRLLNEDISKQQNIKIYWLYLDPGTYYVTVHEKYSNNRTGNQTTYLGFIPTSKIISISGIETDQEKAIVHFAIAEEYNPDLSKSMVRIVPGYIHARYLMSKDLWKDETRENAIESHDFVATENGLYTARILGNNLEPFMFTFEIKGIGEESSDAEVTGEATPEAPEEVPEQGAPEAEPEAQEAEQAPMTAAEMRKYIRMLEDQIEDVGLELPEFDAELTQEQYMNQLEQVLRDHGYDF